MTIGARRSGGDVFGGFNGIASGKPGSGRVAGLTISRGALENAADMTALALHPAMLAIQRKAGSQMVEIRSNRRTCWQHLHHHKRTKKRTQPTRTKRSQ